MKNLHQSTKDHEILFYDRSSEDEQLLIMPLLRKTKTFFFMITTHEPLHLDKWRIQKYEHGGRFKVNIYVLLYEQCSWSVSIRQMKFCTLKDRDHTYKLHLNLLFDGAFEYGGISIF
jgi:hypothetical protein